MLKGICELSASGHGCHVSGIYVGGSMCADDLLLISSTCSDLRKTTTISKDEMKWTEMCIWATVYSRAQ